MKYTDIVLIVGAAVFAVGLGALVAAGRQQVLNEAADSESKRSPTR